MPLVGGAIYLPAFVTNAAVVVEALATQLSWDARMQARLTASMGEAYDYSGISYAPTGWHPEVARIRSQVHEYQEYESNNCLLNFYVTGHGRMGWHSDDVSKLSPGTGIAIVSLGAARVMRFRRSEAPREAAGEQLLEPGSLLFMPGQMQREWQHSLPSAATSLPRISLTFRRIAE